MAAYVRRYARALADVVFSRRIDPKRITAELDGINAILAASHELRTILQTPSVPGDQKLGLVDAIAKRIGASGEVRNFLAVLVDHRRIDMFDAILKQVREELNERLGVAEAEITTARELGSEEKRVLEAQVARATGKTVKAHYSQDSALIGGAVVRVGSTIYDGSVRGQLQKLKEQLANA